jgi:hypothetical protein
VRSIITDDLTNVRDADLIDERRRATLEKRILKDVLEKTDVKAQEVLFPDVTVQ